MDYCPQGDDSPSYYDNTCKGTLQTTLPTGASNYIDTTELSNAYLYALDHGLITSSRGDMLLYNKITRRELAKIIALYAKNIVGITAKTNNACTFKDVSNESLATKGYMQKVCSL